MAPAGATESAASPPGPAPAHGAGVPGALASGAGGLRRALLVGLRAARGIRAERVQMRAMALTYISLFALVPALVVAFSVVQAFTGMERISAEVHEFLLQNLAVGARATIEPYLDRFVRNAHLARAGVVGGALLLWSAYSLFSNVEGALNDLWEVPRRRSLRRQALIYWMGLTLGPLLLAGSATVSQLAQAFLETRGTKTLALLAAALLSSFFLTLLYLVVPSVRVRFRPALAGGVAAGVAWEGAKFLFAWFTARFVRYHAVYGSVAAVPIFLTWLYLSWTIVLFGARLAYVVQNASALMSGGSRRSRELLAGQAVVQVARAYQLGQLPPEPDEVVRAIRGGPAALEVLGALERAGLLRALAGGELVPGRAPEAVTLLDVRRAVRGEEVAGDRRPDPVAGALRMADESAEARLGAITIRDLLDATQGGGGTSSSTPLGPRAGAPVTPLA